MWTVRASRLVEVHERRLGVGWVSAARWQHGRTAGILSDGGERASQISGPPSSIIDDRSVSSGEKVFKQVV